MKKSNSKETKKGTPFTIGWPFKNTGADLYDALDSTRALEDQLKCSSATFEQKFLAVLTTLETLQEASEQLSEESSVMLDLSQGDTNPINRVSSKLDPNLAFVESSAHKLESLLHTLELNSERIDKTLSFESQLNNTFSQLTYIRTLFAVEAAPLEQSAKVMFTSLVEEIHRLQKDVTGIFSDNFQALRKNRGTIATLKSSLQVQSKDQLEIHTKSQMEIDIAVQNQTQILGQDIDTNSVYKKRSDAISQSIGNAIISLQTQDIVSQKIGHIFEVSEEMKLRYASSKELKDKKQRCTELRFIENAALVILSQIDAIKSELQSADRSIDSNLGSIYDSIASMREISANKKSLGKSSDNNKNKGQSLIISLKNVGEMIGTTESFLQHAFKIIEPIRGQATNVSSTIVKLSSQLHLIGLNAEIHAARIGGGTALETLSSKTSGISVETKELCKRISEQLDELSSALHENVNNLESLHDEASAAHASIQQLIPEESKNLIEKNALYFEAQEKANRLMADLQSMTNKQNSHAAFQETMIEELAAMQTQHREISRLAKNAADRLKTDVDIPEVMSGLLSRYTMNSEKAVHMQTLGLQDKSVTKDSYTFIESSSPEIELFDLDFDSDRQSIANSKEAASTSKTQNREFSASIGGNVELF